MDQKDKIILQQLDVIRTMTENGLKRMNTDFWGAPAAPAAPAAPKAEAPKTRAADAKEKEEPVAEELPPPEKLEDLLAELDGEGIEISPVFAKSESLEQMLGGVWDSVKELWRSFTGIFK